MERTPSTMIFVAALCAFASLQQSHVTAFQKPFAIRDVVRPCSNPLEESQRQNCNNNSQLFTCLPRMVQDHGCRGQRCSSLLFSKLSSSEEEQRLLEMAAKLRQEAQLMEQELESVRSLETQKPSTNVDNKEIRWKKLEDSVWAIVYRFSSQPKEADDDDDKDTNKPGDKKESIILPNYSGKFTVKLRDDGFTDLILHEPTGGDGKTIGIQKVWGWDKEFSQDDGMDYLLFSLDVTMPETDPKLPSAKERYYLQARVETKNNEILLKDGTITVKQDVAKKTGGVWGLFNIAGILTEFRYVGNFASRPSST